MRLRRTASRPPVAVWVTATAVIACAGAPGPRGAGMGPTPPSGAAAVTQRDVDNATASRDPGHLPGGQDDIGRSAERSDAFQGHAEGADAATNHSAARGTNDTASTATGERLVGAQLADGQRVDIHVDDGWITAIHAHTPGDACGGDETERCVDLLGRRVVPAFIDSHVHLAYLPEAAAMVSGGVAAAVDLAAPWSFFDEDLAPLRLGRAGPMLTARGGYPTRGWGRGGYGHEVDDDDAAVAAIDDIAARGGVAVKIPLDHGPRLDEATLVAAVSRAHALGLKVVAHALDDESAATAARLGFDALGHTPVGPLEETTIEAWAGRAVICTLAAFGGSEVTVDNLRRLRAAGATVLYGTDFGNTRTAGVDPAELALLARAGLDTAAIVEAATAAPAAFWGWHDLGRIAPGNRASFLEITDDLHADPTALARPERVVIDGLSR